MPGKKVQFDPETFQLFVTQTRLESPESNLWKSLLTLHDPISLRETNRIEFLAENVRILSVLILSENNQNQQISILISLAR